MCILVILRNRADGWPLVVGANRDEYRDRPWDPPRVDDDGILAPRDRRAGGTWIGINRSGLLVAVTNRPEDGAPPERPSRGVLALDLLRAADVPEATERLHVALESTPPGPFRILLASTEDARLATWPGGSGRPAAVETVPDGLHTVTNLRALDELDHGGVLDALDEPEGATLDETLARLRRVLALHEDQGPGGPDTICKHGKDRGTLSSTIVALPGAGDVPAVFLMAPGAPCESGWDDVGPELEPRG